MSNQEFFKILLVENQLFPCVTYMEALVKSSHIKIEAYETYQKMSFRNRFVVSSANGLVSLSVPLKNGREQKIPIRQVQIDDSQNWKREHWKTLVSCYSKSPFFEYYSDMVKSLVFQDQQFLFEFNFSILEWLIKILKIKSSLFLTEQFIKVYNDPTIIDLRNKWLPKNFQNNPENHLIRYSQVFENKIGFQANLSILDLLFNEGPNARNLLGSNFLGS